jgi:hypothetical protein
MNKDGDAPPTAEHRVSQFEPRNRKQPPPRNRKPPPKRLVLRLDEFLWQYEVPDYILDGILQSGYLYSVTA